MDGRNTRNFTSTAGRRQTCSFGLLRYPRLKHIGSEDGPWPVEPVHPAFRNALPTQELPKALPLVTDAITTLVYAKCQVDLCQLYTLSQSTGMNYRLASIPAELPPSPSVLEFDPVDMARLFEAGRRRAPGGEALAINTAWSGT